MLEKIILEMLTQDNVSIKKQKYTILDGIEYLLGEPWRSIYINSIVGRQQVLEDVSELYKSVIMLMWGDKPTVMENSNV